MALALGTNTDALPCDHGRQGGFSLLELLTVLVILGFMAAVAAPATGRFLDTIAFRKQTGKVMATLRYARLMAVAEGEPVTARLSEEGPIMLLEGAVTESRDFGFDDESSIEMEPKQIQFFPEGQATPAQLVVTVAERTQEIIVEPLTGLPVFIDEED